jgi:hypothetical protein
MGRFIGKDNYVFSSQEKQNYREEQNNRRNKAVLKWKEKYITITSLKVDRFWTVAMIRDFLGKPTEKNGFKYFTLNKVIKAEEKSEIKTKLNKRILSKLKRNLNLYKQTKLDIYKEDFLKYQKAKIEDF